VVSPTWGEMGCGLGEEKKRKERKKERIDKIILLYYGREKSTVPEKSPKIPGDRKRHPEE